MFNGYDVYDSYEEFVERFDELTDEAKRRAAGNDGYILHGGRIVWDSNKPADAAQVGDES